MLVRPALTAAVVLLAVASIAAILLEVLAPRQRAALDSTAALQAAMEKELATELALREVAREQVPADEPEPLALAQAVGGGAASGGSESIAGASAQGAPASQDPPLPPPDRRRGEIFYFFSPDWRPADFGKLAVAVEAAFGSGGLEVSFQAFTKYDDFERQLLKYPPKFMIAPAWLDERPETSFGSRYTVVARPLRQGKTTYRKALMTRAGIDSIDDLARGSIAATVHSMGPGEPGPVLGAFRLAADSARIVPVPKDVDALLALSFGQVDAALVTSEQYEQLARTNPADTGRMRVLAFTPEIGLPPVYAAASCDPDLRERLQALLQRLPEVSEGPTVLALLGIDGFAVEPDARAQTSPAPVEPREAGAPAEGPSARKDVAKSPPPDKMKVVGAAGR